MEQHGICQCVGCGASLEEVAVAEWERRQVHDLEPPRLKVTEHQAGVKCCPHCQRVNRGAFPADVNSIVQYGAGVKGLMVYLLEYQLLPFERVTQLLADVFNCKISEGTLYNSRERCFEQPAGVESQIREGMQHAAVGNFDETGVQINGKLWWLHVASNDGLTYYFVHAKRGSLAMDEMNILPQFKGISVHDGWSSYAQYECDHALCNTHHLRELCFIWERYQQVWAEQMSALLIELKRQVEQAQVQGNTALPAQTIQQFESRYHILIATGLAANPPQSFPESPKSRGRPKQSPAKNLLDRLQRHQAEVLALCMTFEFPLTIIKLNETYG